MLIPIDDPADPRIADYRNVRERDLVGRHGRFVAEGEVVLNVLAGSSQARALSLLIADKRAGRLGDLLARFEAAIPVYVASQPVLDAIAGFHLHRGILAIGERIAPPSVANLLASLPKRAVVVGLFGIGNHDNVGGVFRNAAAFGADAVLLDATSCDPLYRKAIRVSVGASLVTPWARFEAQEDPVAMLKAAGFEVVALSPSGATPLSQLARADRVAALFGAEGPGLPPALMALTTTVRIPMASGFDSLNVATTSGIVLHRLSEA